MRRRCGAVLTLIWTDLAVYGRGVVGLLHVFAHGGLVQWQASFGHSGEVLPHACAKGETAGEECGTTGTADGSAAVVIEADQRLRCQLVQKLHSGNTQQ